MAAIAGIVLTLSGQIASAGEDAERFAQSLIDRGFAIMRDDSAGAAARHAKFHDFIVQYIDARKTALFTLGSYRRGADEAVLDKFVAAFGEYAIALYESRLGDYKSATLKVVGSIDNKPGDVTVAARADDPSFRDPVKIGFRLLGSSGNYKIVDVQVAGIWLSVEQRDQFTSLLSRNKGDIGALAAELVERTARMRAEMNAG